MIVQIIVTISCLFRVHIYSIPCWVTRGQLKMYFFYPSKVKKVQRIHPPKLNIGGLLRYFITWRFSSMNETLETIWKRRSIRKYKSKPIPEEHLNLILETARRAPTGANR
ncbi:MAG: nitroreductase family protein, partial [Planctomycetota bacterium]